MFELFCQTVKFGRAFDHLTHQRIGDDGGALRKIVTDFLDRLADGGVVKAQGNARRLQGRYGQIWINLPGAEGQSNL